MPSAMLRAQSLQVLMKERASYSSLSICSAVSGMELMVQFSWQRAFARLKPLACEGFSGPF